MKPNKFAIKDRKIVDSSSTVDFFNQGLNYGACIYEGVRFYRTDNGPAIFRLDDHINRFFYSAKTLKMELGFSEADLKKDICNLVKKTGLQSGYIRPLAFYSEPKMGINILNSEISSVVFVFPWEDGRPTKSVRLHITKFIRTSSKSVDYKAKIAGYYGNNILGLIDARDNGFDEPLFLDDKGFISEGAVNNIFLIKDNVLYTPQTGNILNGITRQSIIELAKYTGIDVIEKQILPDFLKDVDAAFLSGTGIEIETIKEIDGQNLHSENNPIVLKFQEKYEDASRGKVDKFLEWITLVE